MTDTAAPPTDSELAELCSVAPWHASPGYDRDDGTRVGTHQWLHARNDSHLTRLLWDRLHRDEGIWRGCYQMRPYKYRYLTLPDGWTYWHMGSPMLINRDKLTPADRPCP